jgi:Flp pilus assembly protein TadG
MSQRPHGRRSEAGTSTLEVAGLAPLVLLVSFVLVNAGFALYGVTAAQSAAKHGARVYSIQGDESLAKSAAEGALPGWLDASADAGTVADGYRVRVRVDLPDVVPGRDLAVMREAVMP